MCISCDKEMTPVFPSKYNKKLHGWDCECGEFIKAIGRERFFTEDHASTTTTETEKESR